MTYYQNFYQCDCGEEWSDEWTYACFQKCSACDREIYPYASEEVRREREEEA